jgi:hypothetical protein
LMARVGAEMGSLWAIAGVGQVVFGSILLVWAARHYEGRLDPIAHGEHAVHPRAAQVVGLGTVLFSGCAVLLGIAART